MSRQSSYECLCKGQSLPNSALGEKCHPGYKKTHNKNVIFFSLPVWARNTTIHGPYLTNLFSRCLLTVAFVYTVKRLWLKLLLYIYFCNLQQKPASDKYWLWETQVSPVNFSSQMELCIECTLVLLQLCLLWEEKNQQQQQRSEKKRKILKINHIIHYRRSILPPTLWDDFRVGNVLMLFHRSFHSKQICFNSFHVKSGCISCPVIPMQKGSQMALLIWFPLLHTGEHLLLFLLREGSFNMELCATI